MYNKLDLYQITERRRGAIYKTKKVAFHWFRSGEGPDPYEVVPPELVEQNKLPPGEYYYASTLDTIIDIRCPQGGRYHD
jgi:hypothetical protein